RPGSSTPCSHTPRDGWGKLANSERRIANKRRRPHGLRFVFGRSVASTNVGTSPSQMRVLQTNLYLAILPDISGYKETFHGSYRSEKSDPELSDAVGKARHGAI